MQTIINDLDDYDSYNDVEVEISNKEPLLSLVHDNDNVPALYETVMEFADGEFSTLNILTANKTFDLTSSYSSWSGLNEENIVLNTIKVAPKDGVYYDNNMGKYPSKTDGAYYYYDGDSDGFFETIFIADDSGDMIGVGFDYYSDAYFNPHGKHIVQRQVRRNRYSTEAGVFNVKNLIYNELIGFHHEDDFGGYYLEPTFSDALYDLWKIQWEGTASQLIREAEEITFNTFLESLSCEQIQADIMWQTESLLISAVISTYVSPIGGAAVYAMLTTMKGWMDVAEQENYIKAYTYHDSEHYRGKKTLSRKWWSDEWFGETMTTAFTCTTNGIYAPVVFETEKYTYEGQIVLAPANGDLGEGKTNMLGLDSIDWDTENWWDPFITNYKKMNLDYSMQSRSYIAYSDFDDPRVIQYMQEDDIFYEYQDPILYSHNSIAFLEQAVAETTDAKKDRDLNKVIPYMHDYYPVMLFANEEPTSPLPEFYEDYPIIVSSDEYSEISAIGGSYTYDKIYKIWEKSDGEDLKIVPKDTLQEGIKDIDVYLVSSFNDDDENDNFKKVFVATLDSDDYTFDPSSGELTLSPDRYQEFCEKVDRRLEAIEQSWDEDYWERYGHLITAYMIFEIHIEKYRSINDKGNFTSEEMEQIATMQAVQAAILEYYYQFQIATETQAKLDEIAYTTVITVVSTLLTAGIGGAAGLKGLTLWSVASEPFEEVFIDPYIEDATAGLVRQWGGDEYMVVAATTLVSTGRETKFGIFGGSQNVKQDGHAQQQIDATGSNTMKETAEQDEQTREDAKSSSKGTIAKAAATIITVLAVPVLGAGIAAFTSLGTISTGAVSAYWANKVPVKKAFGALIGRFRVQQVIEEFSGDEASALTLMTANMLAAYPELDEAHDEQSSKWSRLRWFNYKDDSYAIPDSVKPLLPLKIADSIWDYLVARYGLIEAIKRTGIKFSLDVGPMGDSGSNIKMNSKIDANDYKTWDEIIKKRGDKLSKLSPQKFYKWFIKNIKSEYANRFKNINLKNSVWNKNSEAQIKAIFDAILKKGKTPVYIYIIINKETGLVRIGQTKEAPPQRWAKYLSKARHGRNGKFYDDVREVIASGKNPNDVFVMKLLDVQEGSLKGTQSEEFWTIYYNRKINQKGYDLNINLEYNKIVGDLIDSPSENFKNIDLDLVISLMKRGVPLTHAAAIIGVSYTTLQNRVYQWFEKSYEDQMKIYIKPILESLRAQGKTDREISNHFFRFDDLGRGDSLLGKRTIVAQCVATCLDIVNYNPSHLFIRSYLLEFVKEGLTRDQIADRLKALGIRKQEGENKGDFYEADDISHLFNRYFDTFKYEIDPITRISYKLKAIVYRPLTKMRHIYLEPFLENLIRYRDNNGKPLSLVQIADELGFIDDKAQELGLDRDGPKVIDKAIGYLRGVLRSRFRTRSITKIRDFLENHYLGHHEYDYYFFYNDELL